MIVTAQPFFNELDLLEIKCRELAGVVDAHVIVESRRTFTGIEKPLHFSDNRARFRGLPIIPVVVDLPEHAESPWIREGLTHREIRAVVRALSPEIVIWGDVDEIPRRDTVERFRAMKTNTASVDLDCVVFYFDRWNPGLRPSASKIGFYDPAQNPQPWRGMVDIPTVENAGWHFQYFQHGDRTHLLDKLRATSHAVEDDGVSEWSMRRQVELGRLPGLERSQPYARERLPGFVQQHQGRFASSFSP